MNAALLLILVLAGVWLLLFLGVLSLWILARRWDETRDRQRVHPGQNRPHAPGDLPHAHTWKQQLVWIDRKQTMFEQVDVCVHEGCVAVRWPRPKAEAA